MLLAVPELPSGAALRSLKTLVAALSGAARVDAISVGPSDAERRALSAAAGGRVSWKGAESTALLAALQARIAATAYDAVVVADGPHIRPVLGELTAFAAAVPVIVAELPGTEPGPEPSRKRPLSRPPAEAWVLAGAPGRSRELLALSAAECRRPTAAWVRARLAALSRKKGPAPSASVSVVVPCWNGLEYTKSCLRSVLDRTDGDFELIVVDNGSEDGTPAFVRSLRDSRVTLIRNETNLGFAKAVNQGLRRARGRYAVWLNNDAVVTGGWAGRLVAGLERAPWIGAIGPYTNETSGPQRLAAATYGEVSRLHAFAAAWAMRHEGRLAWAHRLIGFCLAHRRSVLDEIGYLDERFGLGTYEDFDFCLRLRQAGYELFIAEDAFIHHHGHKSFDGNRVGFNDQVRRNREVFIDKWCRQSLAALDDADALWAAASRARK